MAILVTLIDNPMSRHPGPGGDFVGVTVEMAISAAQAYAAGGILIDFQGFMTNVVGITPAGWVHVEAGGKLLVPVFHNDVPAGSTQYIMQFFATGAGAGLGLDEFPDGALPDMELRLILWGTPKASVTAAGGGSSSNLPVA
jgi:hypothetical protein